MKPEITILFEILLLAILAPLLICLTCRFKSGIGNLKFNLLKGFALLCVLCAFAFVPTARAGQSTQTDTNTLAVLTTNTFLLYGDISGSFTNGQQTGGSQFINCTRGDDVWIEYGGRFTNTTANASNITFRVAQTTSFTMWTNSAQVLLLSVPGNTSNYVAAHVLIQNAAPGYGLRSVENTNGAAVTGSGCYIKAYVKDGI